jgi:hypothetical protein
MRQVGTGAISAASRVAIADRIERQLDPINVLKTPLRGETKSAPKIA